MTTFNDLPMFILSIIEEFDKFPENFTPYTLLPTMNIKGSSNRLKASGSISCFINSGQKCWDSEQLLSFTFVD